MAYGIAIHRHLSLDLNLKETPKVPPLRIT